ncbi:ribose-5-phosphate isomerase [Amycolatopsis jiangsuensis]|uniref:Ribose-5-phosphate isomerase B n=1 Tax=Amycolatopsis jiangsuensis TaxID=1181879 RepID=A0A840IYZ6_9PSEU|nr:ribose-5-phosphate isomerase [Amycolatopsis jiangsuensis]MBB4686913.1 ribose 5-phosphate isomerase B [Amycolatopsis jiangsuensis]
MRIYLGSDHAGFELKNHFVTRLSGLGYEVTDVGPAGYDANDDYPPFCVETARRVVADEGSLGIVIGGSGNGEQIAANKVPGARAALTWNVDTARLARLHNNAQLAGIGARMHTVEEAERIVEAFLTTRFEGGRHQRRIDLLSDYERSGEPPALPGEPVR